MRGSGKTAAGGFIAPDAELLRYERSLAAEGFRFIAGVDEAGRGPLAGPVVAAAVILPAGVPCPPVFDSKQLTAARREELYAALYALPGIRIATGIVSATVIDEINILQATHRAMREAAAQLPETDMVLVDGLPVKGFAAPARNIIKGDALSASIAAASIIAKVTRDRIMLTLDAEYPGYGFAAHKGYGTAAHIDALRRLGATPEHRRSFKPVRDIIAPPPEQAELL